eukprot:Nk52_evm5s161 gene=Nk52_evmTU5s161
MNDGPVEDDPLLLSMIRRLHANYSQCPNATNKTGIQINNFLYSSMQQHDALAKGGFFPAKCKGDMEKNITFINGFFSALKGKAIRDSEAAIVHICAAKDPYNHIPNEIKTDLLQHMQDENVLLPVFLDNLRERYARLIMDMDMKKSGRLWTKYNAKLRKQSKRSSSSPSDTNLPKANKRPSDTNSPKANKKAKVSPPYDL